MPITDKLDNIISKLSNGATNTSGQTIEEKLDVIDGLIDGNGGGSSGGSGSLLITATIQYDNDADQYVCTADKTFEEIVSAIDNGIMPILIENEHDYYQLSSYSDSMVKFSNYLETPDGDGITINTITFNNEEEIDYYTCTIYGNESHGID